jgi:hypothetical protein
MRSTKMKRGEQIVIATVVGVLGLALSQMTFRPRTAETTRCLPFVAPPPPRSASERARREACRWYGAALLVSRQQMEEIEVWDPQVIEQIGMETRRRMAISGTTALRQALTVAERAARLATTRDEQYRSALLLARLDCDAGYHERELTQARKIAALVPGSTVSLSVLWRAARCNGLTILARETEEALGALPARDDTWGRLRRADR